MSTTPATGHCPHCGGALRVPDFGAPPREPDEPKREREHPAALESLKPKLLALGQVIDDMSEDEFGHWLNALPHEEFLEFIVLDNAELGRIMYAHEHTCRSAA